MSKTLAILPRRTFIKRICNLLLHCTFIGSLSCDSRKQGNSGDGSFSDVAGVSELSLGPLSKFHKEWTEVGMYRVGILREVEEGVVKLAAISLVCTHQPCLLRAQHSPTDSGFPSSFLCPCHGSQFSGEGARLSGPARDALKWFRLQISDSGDLVLRLGDEVLSNWRLEVSESKIL